MKLDEFQVYLKSFLSNEDQKVLLVKGEWGVGKTYYISEALKGCDGYFSIKVSLFGMDKIEDISYSISNSILNNITNEKVNKVLNTFTSIPMISKFLPTEKVDLTTIDSKYTKSIIFFDDLERNSLDLQDVFGYIDRIKNNASFKILIAINDDEVKNIKWNFKEKVVDCELRLKSTLEHLIDSMFGVDKDIAKIIFSRLEISNIRTVKKCKIIMDYFLGLSENLDDTNKNKLKVSCLVHSSFYFSGENIDNKQKNEKKKKIFNYDEYFRFNSIIDSYLDSQNIDVNIIKRLNDNLIIECNRNSIVSRIKKLNDLVNNSFSKDTENIILISREILKEKELDFESVIFCVNLLVNLNCKIEKPEIENWLNSSKNINNYNINRMIKIFSNQQELVNLLTNKLEPDGTQFDKVDPNEKNARESEISSILNQMSNSKTEYWLDHITEFKVEDWIAFFYIERCFVLVKTRVKEIIQIIKSSEGHNLRTAIYRLAELPINKYRFENSFSVDLIKIANEFHTV
ncbi:hypothetical protein [Photobacterium iliopiscarium]|uniref:hypothetical protein n=1 Tax=Photobacterium iliopiscarium TaxID=56192 RepID=UPI001E5053F8|nr:hypothetical protein [Photobacterium iliopiscarium]MCD9465602.1 hypothetical protein [Photobacterium iliopiscarium]